VVRIFPANIAATGPGFFSTYSNDHTRQPWPLDGSVTIVLTLLGQNSQALPRFDTGRARQDSEIREALRLE